MSTVAPVATVYQESFHHSPHTRSPKTRIKLSKAMRNNTNKAYTTLCRDRSYTIYGLLNALGEVVYCGMTSQPLHTRLLQHYAVSTKQLRQDDLSFALREGAIKGIRCLHKVSGYSKAQSSLVHAICMFNTRGQGYNMVMPSAAKGILQ